VVVVLTPTKEEDEKDDDSGVDAKKAKTAGPTAVIRRPKFQRLKNGVDLVIEQKISLQEALLGFKFAFKHLDDRVVIVESPPKYIAQHENIIVVEGEGMPQERNPTQHGDLYVKLSIVMPSWDQVQAMSTEQRKSLRTILPSALHTVPNDVSSLTVKHWDEARAAEGETLPAAVHVAKEYSQSEHEAKQKQREEDGKRGESYNEDDEESSGGGQPGCRQM
jgi:DnaJ-class molecular chaperone